MIKLWILHYNLVFIKKIFHHNNQCIYALFVCYHDGDVFKDLFILFFYAIVEHTFRVPACHSSMCYRVVLTWSSYCALIVLFSINTGVIKLCNIFSCKLFLWRPFYFILKHSHLFISFWANTLQKNFRNSWYFWHSVIES